MKNQQNEIFEEALRRYFDLQLLMEKVWQRNAAGSLSEDEALKIAYKELRAERSGDSIGRTT